LHNVDRDIAQFSGNPLWQVPDFGYHKGQNVETINHVLYHFKFTCPPILSFVIAERAMSSTVSSTEVQTISQKPTVLTHRKMEDRTQRLVRTSSLEKIRRFNSYICSQQYYILPALLAWLRSSQSVLQSSTEKTIFFFRSLLFSNFLYKLYQVEFKSLIFNVLVSILKQIQTNYKNVESTFLLKMAVYMAALILATEVGLCFYLLFSTHIPSGLVFLIVCWFYIIYLNARSVYFSAEKRNRDSKRKN
ncbi:hypothetical protein BDFB_010920, partial [Asbolus verrucosus]